MASIIHRTIAKQTGDLTCVKASSLREKARGVWRNKRILPRNRYTSEQVIHTSLLPLTGDWNGDGTTDVGLYVNGIWFLDDGDSISALGGWEGSPKTGLPVEVVGGLDSALIMEASWETLGAFPEPGIGGLPPSWIAGLVLEVAECCATDPA